MAFQLKVKLGLGLDEFLAGWGGVLAQGEGGFGLGWVSSCIRHTYVKDFPCWIP